MTPSLPRRWWLLPLVAACLGAVASAETVEAVVARAGRFLARGRPRECREMLAPRVLEAAGRIPTALYLLGRCREAAGDLPGAIRAYRQAGFLTPDARSVTRALNRLDAFPHPEPSGLYRELGKVHLSARRALSLLWVGRPAAALEVLEDRADAVALAVRAAALGEMGRFVEAEAELALVDGMQPGRAVAPFLRSNFAHWRGETRLEGRLLELARTWSPNSPEIEGALAARAVAAGRTAEVRKYLEWELDQPGADDPYRIVGRAALLTALGDLEDAEVELQAAARAYPPSPQTLVVRAGLELRRGAVEEGVAALSGLLEQAPGNILLLPAANLLASLGRPDLARRAVAGLEPPLRHDPKVRRMLGMLATGEEGEGDALEGTRGAFTWRAAAGTPPEVVRRAVEILIEARKAVDRTLGRPGPEPVVLVIAYAPGEMPWGYYDAVTRRVVFRGDFRASRLGERDLAVVRHVARHEYGHLAFDALVRGEDEPVVTYPRWLMEGIADQLAGGLDYLHSFGYALDALPKASLTEDELARVLAVPILGMGAIPQTDQARAYRQAHDMTGALLARLPAARRWDALAALVLELAGGKDLDDLLRERWGIATADLVGQ